MDTVQCYQLLHQFNEGAKQMLSAMDELARVESLNDIFYRLDQSQIKFIRANYSTKVMEILVELEGEGADDAHHETLQIEKDPKFWGAFSDGLAQGQE